MCSARSPGADFVVSIAVVFVAGSEALDCARFGRRALVLIAAGFVAGREALNCAGLGRRVHVLIAAGFVAGREVLNCARLGRRALVLITTGIWGWSRSFGLCTARSSGTKFVVLQHSFLVRLYRQALGLNVQTLNSPFGYVRLGRRALESLLASGLVVGREMSATLTSCSFLGLTLSNIKTFVKGTLRDCLRIRNSKEEQRPLLLPLGRPSAYGGCDVTAPVVRAIYDLWSRPVVDEDDQICYLPGVDEASSSPHQTVGNILMSLMHDHLFLTEGDAQPSEDSWADHGKTTGSRSPDWSAVQNQPLSELGVPGALVDEVYLAALSLWLCRFAVPLPGDMLRLMFSRWPVSWPAEEARSLFWRGGVRCWYPSEALPPGPIIDKAGHFASQIEVEYFRCLRATFLVLRQRDHLIVKPYSPHRFARQFGFCQDLLGHAWKKYTKAFATEKASPLAQGDGDAEGAVRKSSRKGSKPPTSPKAKKSKVAKKRVPRPKVAKEKKSAPLQVVPAKGIVIRETSPAQGDSRPIVLSLLEIDPLGKGKGLAESVASPKKTALKKKSAAPQSEPFIFVPPPFKKRLRTGLESGEKARETAPHDGSVVLPTGETALEPMLFLPESATQDGVQAVQEFGNLASDDLAIVVAPFADQPNFRQEDLFDLAESEVTRQLGWVKEEAPSTVVVDELLVREAECPTTTAGDGVTPFQFMAGPVVAEGFTVDAGVIVASGFQHPVSDPGLLVAATSRREPFVTFPPSSGEATFAAKEGATGSVCRPVSEDSSTSRPASVSTFPLSARSRLLMKRSVLGLWIVFVKSVLVPADDPCSSKLVADTCAILEHLRGACADTSVLEQWVEDFASEVDRFHRLRNSLAGKLSLAERFAGEAELAQSVKRVNRQRDDLTTIFDRRQAEREAVEAEQRALHDRLAFISSQIDSINGELVTIRRGIDATEEEASALEDQLASVRSRPVLDEGEARELAEVHAE
ncbi:hypothetical protein H6P81_015787 [Aristolochia fimbriata]|uniref:Aminotransferase-like plant mobile domain-containing protein n=1 Tax=Aristolochia fimbriata TaxID=158543 RepID=A0AAV7EA92_ARIFI|nr:hypothetical protein H6P81_015787 [Aristolochia fimbriata]